MFRKILVIVCLLLPALAVSSQNVQLHYVPRHALAPNDMEHNFMLTTVEFFKPDKWGSTFAFIDMTYDGAKGAVNTAYWEIARDLKFWKAPFAAHVEYNGGVVDGVPGAIPNAYLLGASYNVMLGKAIMGTYLAYKYNAFQKHSDDIQWTVTWNLDLLDRKLTLCGYMDLYTENKNRTGDATTGLSGKKCILHTQPQFWFNATQNLSLGSEVEMTSNFYSSDFYVFPTLAAKWTFR